ncbi:MAG: alpha/beta fold hydrolase [Chloroflexota bacterium]
MAKRFFPYLLETQSLTDTERARLGEQFISLPDGFTHYELAGPVGAQPVVLIHGFSVPYYIWDHTFPALVEAGFQPLRYDLYGRGYSDRPNVTNSPDLFDRQLVHLISALNLKIPVDLVGLSMGGPISITFADRHPELVRKLVLVDPAGIPMEVPLAFKLVTNPFWGKVLLDLLGGAILPRVMTSDFYNPQNVKAFLKQYRPQMRYQGFIWSLLSTLRNGMLGDFTDVYARVGGQKVPTLLIWGREDQTLPFELSQQILALIPHAEFHPIDEGGHIPHYERPEVVNPIIIRFLRS